MPREVGRGREASKRDQEIIIKRLGEVEDNNVRESKFFNNQDQQGQNQVIICISQGGNILEV